MRQRQHDVERTLAGHGRLLLRRSGTEPLVRVMAEAEDAALVDEAVSQMCAVLEKVTQPA